VSLLPRLAPLQLRGEKSQALLGLGPRRWAAANGALLALGLVSRIGFWVWYVVPLSCFASGSIVAGAAIWGSYGLSRMGVASCAAYAMRADSAGTATIGERLLDGRARAEPASRAALAVLAAALSLQLGL
jgi:hypothetical protein